MFHVHVIAIFAENSEAAVYVKFTIAIITRIIIYRIITIWRFCERSFKMKWSKYAMPSICLCLIEMKNVSAFTDGVFLREYCLRMRQVSLICSTALDLMTYADSGFVISERDPRYVDTPRVRVYIYIARISLNIYISMMYITHACVTPTIRYAISLRSHECTCICTYMRYQYP